MAIGPEELAYYDTERGDYVVEPGEFEIMMGPSSDEARLLKIGLLVR